MTVGSRRCRYRASSLPFSTRCTHAHGNAHIYGSRPRHCACILWMYRIVGLPNTTISKGNCEVAMLSGVADVHWPPISQTFVLFACHELSSIQFNFEFSRYLNCMLCVSAIHWCQSPPMWSKMYTGQNILRWTVVGYHLNTLHGKLLTHTVNSLQFRS